MFVVHVVFAKDREEDVEHAHLAPLDDVDRGSNEAEHEVVVVCVVHRTHLTDRVRLKCA